jgi:UDP-N-acetylglucosamine 2-epimerase (non-hydrolysing)
MSNNWIGVKFVDKIKVLTVFGTRPEAIKMAPLVKELEKSPYIDSKVCVTAQHRQMLDQVLELFKIKPEYDLNIMKDRQTLYSITTNALNGLADVLQKENPNLVLVHGDTTTTFVAALAAFYNNSLVGHVEAGLRTFDKHFPYPEEMNRKLTGALADLNFAPTRKAKENLLREGISENNIFITGNTVIDALQTTIDEDYKFEQEYLNKINYSNKIIAVTAHRRENWGEPINNICRALKRLVEAYKDVEIVYPVHMNPVVRDSVNSILGNVDRVHILEPLDTKDMHNLMKKSYMVMTDSGGLQEEAPSLGKPVLVLRGVTERPEAVEAGTVKIAGTDEEEIFRLADELISNQVEYLKMANSVNPYGDGNASRRIVQAIEYYYEFNSKPEDFLI